MTERSNGSSERAFTLHRPHKPLTHILVSGASCGARRVKSHFLPYFLILLTKSPDFTDKQNTSEYLSGRASFILWLLHEPSRIDSRTKISSTYQTDIMKGSGIYLPQKTLIHFIGSFCFTWPDVMWQVCVCVWYIKPEMFFLTQMRCLSVSSGMSGVI